MSAVRDRWRLPRPGRSPRNLAERVEDRLQLRRQRCGRADQVAIRRRRQLEPPGMQEPPPETVRPTPRGAGPVHRIAGDRMPDRVEMDPDLVRSPGHEVELEERPSVEPLADAVS